MGGLSTTREVRESGLEQLWQTLVDKDELISPTTRNGAGGICLSMALEDCENDINRLSLALDQQIGWKVYNLAEGNLCEEMEKFSFVEELVTEIIETVGVGGDGHK